MKSTKQHSGFEVPEDFFEKQKTQLLHRVTKGGFEHPNQFFINQKQTLLAKTNIPVKIWHRKLFVFTGAAASFLIATLCFLFYPKNEANNAVISEQIIENYLIENNVDEELIAAGMILSETNTETEALIETLNTEDILTEL